ncbi:hypothetical protein DPEC_G00082120 [Dallia pectoralis]|uniref:Uncharacterized protein n=1 Tax=Dallia pectoralis TaxID=75939 RepID=A0ACC2GYL3_DALPE|nr:hypothetical protein DPEC_G00082120 [Dallia pectoralis]
MDERAHSFRRLKLMSSPSLSDPVKTDKAALEERGTQQRKAGANATWNSIHNAVIAVFQKKDLGENELCILNEGVRQLLKTELGSFFTEYLHNQLLTKGMVILRDKIRFYEGQKLLDSLGETWNFFFCDVLSMLQAIFYPVQGKEPSVRQLALLHFRNNITLNVKLDDALSRPRARVPPAIIQMLLVLQGVHESTGVNEDYLRLEGLVQKVVSPYLGSHGLFSNDGSSMQNSSCVLEKRLHRRWPKPGDIHAKNPVVRSQSYNVPMLTPLVEYDVETGSVGNIGIRRHSVCEMTSCLEEGSVTDTVTSLGSSVQSGPPSLDQDLSFTRAELSRTIHAKRGGVYGVPHGSGLEMGSIPSCSSSPDTVMDQILDSLDSDPDGISDHDGIYIEFAKRRCSDWSSGYSGRQSVV